LGLTALLYWERNTHLVLQINSSEEFLLVKQNNYNIYFYLYLYIMARSRKTTFRKKTQQKAQEKARKSRKQQGGGIHYDQYLQQAHYDQYLQQAKNDIFAAHSHYYRTTDDVYGSSFWAEDPIKIPGMGMYVGKYYLWNYTPIMSGTGMLTSFEKDEKTGLPEFIKEGDWKNNKENGWFIMLYGNGDVASSVHMKNGFPLSSWTEKGRKGEGDLASQYTYSNGQIYQGDLILKEGKLYPANDLNPQRTVFNFAPGPTVVYTREGKTIKIPDREAERGFRMSQDPDFVPPTPPNSPQRETVVVRRGVGARGRLSGIRDSRMTAEESGPMDRQQELRQMRELAASQRGFKPLPSLERKSVLPSITRRGGKYRRGKINKKGKKTRKN
jgi:hypothetical protein